ncbi:tetratricopeptide repeat protein [Desulfoprunum benzoelyticum]|uniref:Tetratricopeptide (TPR) repeat protein n=1 Tax=Desulfoprunum benzoelyticum TaxID=1506996 RepID=A0A840UT63_9BACT|nr:tetratricopeptide repeat protein [Desulfoprunum benzoelyticum]MBB5349387.1 tetratricopeptide (TPR) repeat protein [Desulfoprunum benzoelyticum]MBM9531039.1 tetratricopeptide repeat protein [Desulfoprunum benzoelyticum]
MERFPIPAIDWTVENQDFIRFSQEYSRILRERIPTAAAVAFYAELKVLETVLPEEVRAMAADLFDPGVADHETVIFAPDGLLLPFVTGRRQVVVARLSGLDPLVVDRMAKDWLAEVQAAAFRDFLAVKRTRIEAVSGLCNITHLYALLETPPETGPFHLVLIELPPRTRSSRDAFQNARRAAFALQACVGDSGIVHHLGQCVFAIFLRDMQDEDFSERYGSKLVALLKRDGFYRVHVGSSSRMGESLPKAAIEEERDRLLSEAWAALQTAERRGPFTFCDYRVLAHPERHPLFPPSEGLICKVRRKYSRSKQFCLVELAKEGWAGDRLANLVGRHLAPGLCFADAASVILFLEGVTGREAHQQVVELLRTLDRETGADLQVSAGIGAYPFADFHKGEIPANCRKALLHGAFFGPGAVVEFDAVSLNISGDIYYGDGDLSKAMAEYRRGLVCDPDNVNLLNSLGVTYAMLDRHSVARESFRKALAIEPDNFMALYNLGLGEVRRGELHGSLKYFERALEVYCEDDGLEIRKDLQLQLAKLYCHLGLFDRAYPLLMEWHDAATGGQQSGPALRYLGETCYGLGRKEEAKIWLQKALRFNELDPEALSLLGLVYMEEGEGHQIALALCDKGVELNPDNAASRLRLAKVQIACDMLAEARQNLMKCRGDKRILPEIQVCLGQLWLKLGRKRQADRWFAKVLQSHDLSPELAGTARGFMRN